MGHSGRSWPVQISFDCETQDTAYLYTGPTHWILSRKARQGCVGQDLPDQVQGTDPSSGGYLKLVLVLHHHHLHLPAELQIQIKVWEKHHQDISAEVDQSDQSDLEPTTVPGQSSVGQLQSDQHNKAQTFPQLQPPQPAFSGQLRPHVGH